MKKLALTLAAAVAVLALTGCVAGADATKDSFKVFDLGDGLRCVIYDDSNFGTELDCVVG
jgi:hypothetical protein